MLLDKLFAISPFGHEITLWVLFFLSIIGLAVVMEKYYFLQGWKKSTALATKIIKQAIETNHIDEVKSLHTSFLQTNKDPGTKLISQYLEKNPHLVVSVFDSFVMEKKNTLESNLSLLATIGSNAPFIGLLGTIFGVMDAFNALGLATGASASIVMLGIAKALLATAVGLIVAIPSIISYNYLRRKVTIIIQNFEYIKEGYSLLVKHNNEKKTQNIFKSKK